MQGGRFLFLWYIFYSQYSALHLSVYTYIRVYTNMYDKQMQRLEVEMNFVGNCGITGDSFHQWQLFTFLRKMKINQTNATKSYKIIYKIKAVMYFISACDIRLKQPLKGIQLQCFPKVCAFLENILSNVRIKILRASFPIFCIRSLAAYRHHPHPHPSQLGTRHPDPHVVVVVVVVIGSTLLLILLNQVLILFSMEVSLRYFASQWSSSVLATMMQCQDTGLLTFPHFQIYL